MRTLCPLRCFRPAFRFGFCGHKQSPANSDLRSVAFVRAVRFDDSIGFHKGSGPTARSIALIACAEMVNVGLAASAPGIVEPSTM